MLNSIYVDNYKLIVSIFENKTKKLALLNMNHEDENIRNMDVKMNAKKAYYKIKKTGPNKKLEDIIANDPGLSYLYAKDILHDRFEKGEDAIAIISSLSYLYAINVLHGRFKKGEDTIAKYSGYSYYYAKDILYDRFEKGEDSIAKDPNYSYLYAKDVLHSRFKKGEDSIAKYPSYSYQYVVNILHSRFKKGEIRILNSLFAGDYKLVISIFEDKTKKLAILNMNHEDEDIRNACKWMLK